MSYLEALIIAIIEGITEFLPVSSTGHMIIAESLMGLYDGTASDKFVKLFTVAIQFGAILSIVVLYWKRFFKSVSFYVNILIGTAPILLLAFLIKDYIDEWLDNPVLVGFTLLIGGIVFLFIDRITGKTASESLEKEHDLTPALALKAGFFQCLGLVPGVSRSASTIIGGLLMGLNRRTAAEFSFFIAVPTMAAATLYKLYDAREALTTDSLPLLLFGNVVAFLVALVAVRLFVNFLSKNGFKVFGWYRIILGLSVIVYFTLQ